MNNPETSNGYKPSNGHVPTLEERVLSTVAIMKNRYFSILMLVDHSEPPEPGGVPKFTDSVNEILLQQGIPDVIAVPDRKAHGFIGDKTGKTYTALVKVNGTRNGS